MQHVYLVLHPGTQVSSTTTINTLMRRFVAVLPADEATDPLTYQVSLATIWGALQRLSGALPCVDAPQPNNTRSLVDRTCEALLANLAEDEVPVPLWQPLTLGLVWADLCRLAGEDAPPAVNALLDERVTA